MGDHLCFGAFWSMMLTISYFVLLLSPCTLLFSARHSVLGEVQEPSHAAQEARQAHLDPGKRALGTLERESCLSI